MPAWFSNSWKCWDERVRELNSLKHAKKLKNVENWHFSREIEVGQNNVNKIDNFSREIEVGQNNVNKSDKFSREIEVGKLLKN